MGQGSVDLRYPRWRLRLAPPEDPLDQAIPEGGQTEEETTLMTWILFGTLTLLMFLWKPTAPPILLIPVAALLTGLVELGWKTWTGRKQKP